MGKLITSAIVTLENMRKFDGSDYAASRRIDGRWIVEPGDATRYTIEATPNWRSLVWIGDKLGDKYATCDLIKGTPYVSCPDGMSDYDTAVLMYLAALGVGIQAIEPTDWSRRREVALEQWCKEYMQDFSK